MNSNLQQNLNSLYILVKASVPESTKAFVDHSVNLLGQHLVYVSQQLVTGRLPLFGRYLDEPFRDNVEGVVWKLPGSCPEEG